MRKRLPVTFQAILRADATIERLVITVLEPGAPVEAMPRETATMEFRGDSVIAVGWKGDSTKVVRFATRPGALAYHPQVPHPLPAGADRPARADPGREDGAGARLPAERRRAHHRPGVEFRGADSAVVSLGTIEARLAVDAAGSVLGGRAQRDQGPDRVARRTSPPLTPP